MKRYIFLLLSFFLIAHSAHAATITGKVNFTGTAPAPKTLDTKSDPSCASHRTTPLLSEEVVVNPDNTLKNVFVYIKEGLEGKTFPAKTEPVHLDQAGCQYVPHVFGLQVGQPLEIKNSDATLHNVHSMAKTSKEFNLGMPIKGMKITRKFDKPEVMVKFKCDVHPWMSAYIGVLTHPFFAVTSENGTFEIKDLPAGTYTLEAWQEKYGAQQQTITVDEAGAVTADFTFAG